MNELFTGYSKRSKSIKALLDKYNIPSIEVAAKAADSLLMWMNLYTMCSQLPLTTPFGLLRWARHLLSKPKLTILKKLLYY